MAEPGIRAALKKFKLIMMRMIASPVTLIHSYTNSTTSACGRIRIRRSQRTQRLAVTPTCRN
jgi:hypothetical protein